MTHLSTSLTPLLSPRRTMPLPEPFPTQQVHTSTPPLGLRHVSNVSFTVKLKVRLTIKAYPISSAHIKTDISRDWDLVHTAGGEVECGGPIKAFEDVSFYGYAGEDESVDLRNVFLVEAKFLSRRRSRGIIHETT
jgi:hypothetical protein